MTHTGQAAKRSRTVLVTGAAGFIGSSLTDRLLSLGWRVVGLDNFDPSYDRSVKESNLASAIGNDAFTFIEGDVCDTIALDALEFDVEAVVHLAGKGGVRGSALDPMGYSRANLMGTSSILAWASRSGVQGVVFASSSSVYGRRDSVPFRESDPAVHPISHYAATKRAGELLCTAAVESSALSIACLRYFSVYGPRQRPDMAAHTFARTLQDGLPLTLFGDGSSVRDYTYVDDAVAGTIQALDWVASDRGTCGVFNIGSGRTIRLDRFANLIADAMGVVPTIERAPTQVGDVPITCADTERSARELGYRPCVSIETGVGRFIDWFRQSQGS